VDVADLCFVTGADQRYFWIVNATIQSLKEQSPGLQVHVMDFGFTPAQARFLEAEGTLLPRPPEIPDNVHPYTLKTCFGLYVRKLDRPNHIWVDSDMMCMQPLQPRALALIGQMKATGRQFAICPDMGPNPTLADFARNLHAPALTRFIDESPSRASLTYLNTGFIAFAGASAFLAQWPRLTARIQGEQCIDQNAFNMLFHANAAQGLVLDPKTWNAHGELLTQAECRDGIWWCGSEQVVLFHCTSHQNIHHTPAIFNLRLRDRVVPLEFKTFRNPALQKHHLQVLERFLQQKGAALVEAGAL
jgi:hypothetical protein